MASKIYIINFTQNNIYSFYYNLKYLNLIKILTNLVFNTILNTIQFPENIIPK